MAKILGSKIPGLVAKQTAGGLRYYWQPSATLKRAAWRSQQPPLDSAA